MTPDTLTFADARSARLASAWSGAVELVGRSPAISRVQELIRRGGRRDAGTLITARARMRQSSRSRASCMDAADARTLRSSAVDCGTAEIRRRRSAAVWVGAGPVGLEPAKRGSRSRIRDAGQLRSPPPAAGRSSSRTSPSCRAGAQARLARIARDGEVRIDGAPVATAVPPDCQRVPRTSTPTCTRIASAAISTADCRRRASICRRSAIGADDVPALAQRLLDDRARPTGAPARSFTQAALALLGALTWPGNLAELRDAIDRVVAERTSTT